MIQRQIDVALGERSYPVYVGTTMTSTFGPACEQHGVPKRVVIITDRNVAPHYLRPLEKNLRHHQFDVASVIIPPGERQKSLARANAIFSELLTSGVGRKSAVVALGGGVIGDLAGFVAATYHRGITLIQVPTTLLSQVDSAVGGKVAVNHPLGKNMIGAFYQPRFVWADVECLRTLPDREIVCGLGEIVKYGVIFDEEFFTYLETHLDPILHLEQEAVMHVQARCCELKARLVSEDERETGRRVILNLGHTVGHALEAAGQYRVLKHGEAVLLGMVAESFIAREMGLVNSEAHERIVGLVRRIPLRVNVSKLQSSAVLRAMNRDKKSVGSKKRFVLPRRIGDVEVVENVEAGLLKECVRLVLKRRWAQRG